MVKWVLIQCEKCGDPAYAIRAGVEVVANDKICVYCFNNLSLDEKTERDF